LTKKPQEAAAEYDPLKDNSVSAFCVFHLIELGPEVID